MSDSDSRPAFEQYIRIWREGGIEKQESVTNEVASMRDVMRELAEALREIVGLYPCGSTDAQAAACRALARYDRMTGGDDA